MSRFRLNSIDEFASSLLADFFGLPKSSCNQIAYARSNETTDTRFKIVRSDFFDDNIFGTDASLPAVPVALFEGLPVLFGGAHVETNETQSAIHIDLVATAYFLMTRYEEVVRSDVRDRHGRFPGIESFSQRTKTIRKPILDLWRDWFRQHLENSGLDIGTDERRFKLTLTHDVDHPLRYNSLRKTVRGTAANLVRRTEHPLIPIKSFLAGGEDPYDTFDWIAEKNLSTRDQIAEHEADFEEIYFFMACDKGLHDGNYRIESKRVRKLIGRLQKQQSTFGLHPSYAAGGDPTLIASEKNRMESVTQTSLHCSRHHYLRFREPEHYQYLTDAGFTDDYTGGFADGPGFRYGTSRPFRFFDPATGQPTQLTMHPLQMMDVSFESTQYLGLSVDDAIAYATPIIKTTIEHAGELVILFHNNQFAGACANYHREFYTRLLDTVVHHVSAA